MNNPTDLALLDTNVLIYADQRRSRYHQAAKSLRDRGQRGGYPSISPQVLSDFLLYDADRWPGHGKPLSGGRSYGGAEYLDSEQILMIYPTPGSVLVRSSNNDHIWSHIYDLTWQRRC